MKTNLERDTDGKKPTHILRICAMLKKISGRGKGGGRERGRGDLLNLPPPPPLLKPRRGA